MPKERDRYHRSEKKKGRTSKPGSENKLEGNKQALRTETYRRRSASKGLRDLGLPIRHRNRQEKKLSKNLKIKGNY